MYAPAAMFLIALRLPSDRNSRGKFWSMRESSESGLDWESENTIFRVIRRLAAGVWEDLLTGTIAGLEIAYLWWYFLAPFASGSWQKAAVFMSEHIYQGTPR